MMERPQWSDYFDNDVEANTGCSEPDNQRARGIGEVRVCDHSSEPRIYGDRPTYLDLVEQTDEEPEEFCCDCDLPIHRRVAIRLAQLELQREWQRKEREVQMAHVEEQYERN